jgi:GR25 family glycosyltransferase involved in LPS biosynthesis
MKDKKTICDLFADLISLGETPVKGQEYLNLYTRAESKQYNRFNKINSNMTEKNKYLLQEKAYFITLRTIKVFYTK